MSIIQIERYVWYEAQKQKGNRSRRRIFLLNVAYYKSWAGKHFAYYVIGQGIEGHGVSGAKEIFS